jgi:hypothetical protein
MEKACPSKLLASTDKSKWNLKYRKKNTILTAVENLSLTQYTQFFVFFWSHSCDLNEVYGNAISYLQSLILLMLKYT